MCSQRWGMRGMEDKDWSGSVYRLKGSRSVRKVVIFVRTMTSCLAEVERAMQFTLI